MALFCAFSKIWPLEHRSFWYIIYAIYLEHLCSKLCIKLWRCIQFDPDYDMGYFSTSGWNLETGSWLFCDETDYITVSKFQFLSHICNKHMICYISYDFKFYCWFTIIKIFEIRPRNFFKSFFVWAELTRKFEFSKKKSRRLGCIFIESIFVFVRFHWKY